MAREINTRIQHKMDTVAAWEAVQNTFVPLSGELIIYKGNNNYNFKIGDGTNKLKDLPFTDNVQLTIKQNNQSKGTFKANQTSDVTVELTDTWKPNTASQEGYVAAGGTANKVWRTDGEGTPCWGDWTTANNGALTIKQNNTLKGTFTANQAIATEVNLTDTIPNDGKLTIKQNGVNKGEFTANQADAKIIELTDTTPNDATLTIKQNNVSKGTFSANQATNASIELTDTTYGVATTSVLGLVKSGGDVTVDSSTGIMSVVNDSHTHDTQYYTKAQVYTKEQVYTRDQVYTKSETETAVRNTMNSWLTQNIYTDEY